MPKRKLTRSSLNSSPTKSPGLDKFYRSTKERKLDMSPKHLNRSRATSSTSKSPDIRKYLSPVGDMKLSPSVDLPTIKRTVPKRRVNLNSVFDHIVTRAEVPIYKVTTTCTTESQETMCLKRSQPQACQDEPPAKYPKHSEPQAYADEPPAKCTRTESDDEQLVESSAPVISAVSYKTDLPPLSDPNVCPPPCIKRTWKSGPSRPGVKLFEANSPQTSSKLQLLCRKLWFSSPNNCEIHTLS